jgi:tRNA(Ser,Leu) C12 N-acetylase TAN1
VNDHFGNAGKGDRACNTKWRSLYEGLMRMSMNTRLSGSARVDDINSPPQGEIRGLTKLVNITEDVRKYAAEQNISDSEAFAVGLKQKAKEFVQKGAEVYAKA